MNGTGKQCWQTNRTHPERHDPCAGFCFEMTFYPKYSDLRHDLMKQYAIQIRSWKHSFTDMVAFLRLGNIAVLSTFWISKLPLVRRGRRFS